MSLPNKQIPVLLVPLIVAPYRINGHRLSYLSTNRQTLALESRLRSAYNGKTTVVAKSIFYRISLVLLKTSLTTMYYVAVFLLLTTNSLFAQGRELTPDRVNQRVQLAAVEVLVNGRLSGSGAVIDRDGIVLTAAHVANARDITIEVLLANKIRLPATVYGKDASHDILLLRLPEKDGGYNAIPLSRKLPLVGSNAFLVGSPLFRHRLLFTGTVAQSTISAEFLNPHYVEVFYIQSASPHGTSGGAWVNGHGQLIGLQSAMLFVNNSPQGIAIVAPLSAIKHLLDHPHTISVASAGFAVEELWEQPPNYLQQLTDGATGVVIKVIIPGSPLEKAQIPIGTIVTSIDDKPIQTRDAYVAAIRAHKPGDEVILKVRTPNNKAEREISFKLGSLQ